MFYIYLLIIIMILIIIAAYLKKNEFKKIYKKINIKPIYFSKYIVI